MRGRYLLDTNIVIALFANDSAVTDQFEEAAEVFVPSIVIGELYYGARKSSRASQNIARLDEFTANSVVLACDTETARWYAEVQRQVAAESSPDSGK